MALKTKPSIWERIESGDIDSLRAVVPYPIMVLRGKMRDYIIQKVKDPLRKVLETGRTLGEVLKTVKIIAERIPLMTKRNVLDQRTHNLMAIEEKFFSFNNSIARTDMLRAGWKLFKFEICHDEFYQGRHDWLIEEIVKLILTGEWVPRSPNNPLPAQQDDPLVKLWTEPQPYGGKYTITYALQQNREAIIDLLGKQWQWLKKGKYAMGGIDDGITTTNKVG